jgi:hypothetical protein
VTIRGACLARDVRKLQDPARLVNGTPIAWLAAYPDQHFIGSFLMYVERALQNAGRNPFYLLSALSMLFGCFVLSQHLTLSPGQWKPLVGLMGVLQIYEFLLLGLALYLNRGEHTRTDAMTAFLLGLLFLVDATHLNAELSASAPFVAVWVSGALLVLAAVKLGLLRRALGLTSRRAFTLTFVQIAIVLFLPVTVNAIQFPSSPNFDRELVPRALYGLWWLVGAVPIAYLWVEGNPDRGSPTALRIGRAALMLPLGSIFLHFIALHWLYRLPFQASYVTPLLLGATTYASFSFGRRLDALLLLFRWAAPVSAALFSLGGEALLTLSSSGIEVVVSPLRIALLALALAWLLHRAHSGEKAFGRAAFCSLLLALSGHAPGSMVRTWGRIVPETAVELGVAAIVAAFAFLALGLAKSLLSPVAPPSRVMRNRS